MTRPRIVLVVSALQDIGILRPLAFLAARETDAELGFLVTEDFALRDAQGTWRRELSDLARRVGADVRACADPAAAFLGLQDGWGVIVAASESDLPAHREVHAILRVAPPSYLRVTLQHGLECVGFLQNREHSVAHGEGVTFAADILCAWSETSRLNALVPSQQAKVLVTGPTALLVRREPASDDPPVRGGLVCENLHSARLRATGAHGQPFMETFERFCALLGDVGEPVTLRPHPGGQYVLRNRMPVHANVVLNNRPIYRVDLSAYEYGISAPSTVVLDLVLAGVPVAVWQDPNGIMDLATYDGLTRISTIEYWLAFARDARVQPERLLTRQRRWLEGLGMPLDPKEVYRRFARLLVGATTQRDGRDGPSIAPSLAAGAPSRATGGSAVRTLGPLGGRSGPFGTPRSILVACDQVGATQALSFGGALAGRAAVTFIECADRLVGLTDPVPPSVPDVLVLSRLLSPRGGPLIEWARREDVPVIFHIDDDLLDVPDSLGPKAAHYRDPSRRACLRANMEGSDLVYASTPFLAERLRLHGISTPIVTGALACSVDPEALRPGMPAAEPTLGYMGTGGHAADLALVVPAIEDLMLEMPALRFETFGTIAMPPRLERFGSRVRHHGALRDYGAFLDRLRELGWWVGLAPLVDHPFNRCKTDCKWMEYSFAGIAAVAQDLPVYARACADGTGRLARDAADWSRHLRELLADGDARGRQVAAAQAKLRATYTHEALGTQVLAVLADAQAHRPRRIAKAC